MLHHKKNEKDPLDHWVRYLEWISHAYSNKSAKYRRVLEQLTVEFTSWTVIDYRHDRRYVNAWLSYVHRVRELPFQALCV